MEYVALADDGIDKIAVSWQRDKNYYINRLKIKMKAFQQHADAEWIQLTIKLVLDNVVESLKKEEDKVVVLNGGEQKPGGGEGLQQVE